MRESKEAERASALAPADGALSIAGEKQPEYIGRPAGGEVVENNRAMVSTQTSPSATKAAATQIPANAWFLNTSTGYFNYSTKTNSYRVRAVAPVPTTATDPAVYDIPFSSILEAWTFCERNKPTSRARTRFRWHAPRNLRQLWEKMRAGSYKPGASSVFIVKRPTIREIWAPAFIDQVANAWVVRKSHAVMESFILEAGDRSMNSRPGYGPLRGVKEFQKMLKSYTGGYARPDCWILKGDFANFFMSVDKPLLMDLLEKSMREKYSGEDLEAVLYMTRTILSHRCADNCFRLSDESEWSKLPPVKSLFNMDGLTIGWWPSQIWTNFLGAFFTRWMLHEKKADGFIIFTDDWSCLVRTPAQGRKLIREIRGYLADTLHLTLHPRKIYLQHYHKGVKMIGAVVKPGRTYISNRTRARFISAVLEFNRRGATDKARREMLGEVRSKINSYLGLMSHHKSYRVRRQICLEMILPVWGRYLYFVDEFARCEIRVRYDPWYQLKRKLHKRDFAARMLRPKW